jgi:hypothetical protein
VVSWCCFLSDSGGATFGTAAAVAVGGLIALIAAALILYGRGRGTMPNATAEVPVDADAATALRNMEHALLVLDESGEVTVDAESSSAWLNTRQTWRSSGERVTAEFDGRVIRVTSQSRHPVSVDYGKNRANVKTVIAALERVYGRSDLSG